jgi:L,D-transpeptidase YcbB
MILRRFFLVLLFIVFTPVSGYCGSAKVASIEARLNGKALLEVAGYSLAKKKLKDLYVAQGYRTLWFADDGAPTELAKAMVGMVEKADEDGLEPSRYTPSVLKSIVSGNKFLPEVDADLFLSHAFLQYLSDASTGMITPKKLEPEVPMTPRKVDVIASLLSIIASDDVASGISSILPPHPEYTALKKALAKYKCIREYGGWVRIPNGKTILPGAKDPRISLIAKRLNQEGYLRQGFTLQHPSSLELEDEGLEYTGDLIDAVMAFQENHGLNADAVLGPDTIAELNVPVSERIEQIRINLERWRWMPQDFGHKHVRINIAGFELTAYRGENKELQMRTVVGKNYRQTPMFSSHMTDIIFNPFWHVPGSIAKDIVLPEMVKDPEYYKKGRFEFFERGEDKQLKPVDPETIDFTNLDPANTSYILRQKPGAHNALGRIKFNIDNPWSIYVHDTSDPQLFMRESRTLSSGCIRIEHPLDLAYFLLENDAEWNKDKINNEYEHSKRKSVKVALPEKVDVHIHYWTAWVNDKGDVQFRKDVYGQDEAIKKSLYFSDI